MQLENKEVFAKNFKKFIEKSGKERKEIAAELNIPYSTLTEWANARKYPRIDSIEKLAMYFGVSKSELIEDFDEIKKDNDTLVTIIVKLRMDKDLLEIVEKIVSLDKLRLESLRGLLNTFT